MNLTKSEEGKEYIIRRIDTDDEELDAFLFLARLLQRRADNRRFPQKGKLYDIGKRRKIQHRRPAGRGYCHLMMQ